MIHRRSSRPPQPTSASLGAAESSDRILTLKLEYNIADCFQEYLCYTTMRDCLIFGVQGSCQRQDRRGSVVMSSNRRNSEVILLESAACLDMPRSQAGPPRLQTPEKRCSRGG